MFSDRFPTRYCFRESTNRLRTIGICRGLQTNIIWVQFIFVRYSTGKSKNEIVFMFDLRSRKNDEMARMIYSIYSST